MTADEADIALFEVVDVLETPRTIEFEIAGSEGVVVGVSKAAEGAEEQAYAVLIDQLDRTIMVRANELRATGRRVAARDIYDNTSIRVSDEGKVREDLGHKRRDR